MDATRETTPNAAPGKPGASQMRYDVRLRLRGEEIFFGPGVVQLLRLVDDTGSLSAASKSMGMAYSKAWRLVNVAEQQLGFAMLRRKAGGERGGGSELTPRGRVLADKFDEMLRRTQAAADVLFAEIFAPGWEGEDEEHE